MAILKILDKETWTVRLDGPPQERESSLNPGKQDYMYLGGGQRLPSREDKEKDPNAAPSDWEEDAVLFASQYLHDKIQATRSDLPYPVTVQIARFTGDNGFTKWTVKLAQASPGASAPTGGDTAVTALAPQRPSEATTADIAALAEWALDRSAKQWMSQLKQWGVPENKLLPGLIHGSSTIQDWASTLFIEAARKGCRVGDYQAALNELNAEIISLRNELEASRGPATDEPAVAAPAAPGGDSGDGEQGWPPHEPSDDLPF